MIPVNEPLLNGNEKKYLAECIDTGWISSDGPFIKKFEESFASYIGYKNGIAVCNGTASLETALYAIGLSKGDEVILPSFTIISCVLAILKFGAIPVLVDVDRDTWCMNVQEVEKKITKKTKALMPVHMYGHPVDMEPLQNLAKQYSLKIVEDAAQAHGARYQGKKCGALGDVSSFSFYANKIITTGEGGMVLTDDPEAAERARAYRNLCFGKMSRFCHEDLGYNFRMSNLQAAVGFAQMERIEEFLAIKKRNAALYQENLKDIPGLQLPVQKPWAENVYWMYGIVLDPKTGYTAEKFAESLKNQGILTRPFFLGMHEQPVLLDKGLFKGVKCPVSERIARYGLYLPSGMTLKSEQIALISQAIKKILAGS